MRGLREAKVIGVGCRRGEEGRRDEGREGRKEGRRRTGGVGGLKLYRQEQEERNYLKKLDYTPLQKKCGNTYFLNIKNTIAVLVCI